MTLAGPKSGRHLPVESGVRLVGWPWRASLLVLAVGAVLDLLLAVGGGSPTWPVALLFFIVVSFVAVRALRAGGERLFAAAGRAAALSLTGTVVLGIASVVNKRWAATDFGLVEGAALTLVLVACWRRAVGRQRISTALVALAVVALPLRLGWSLDVVPFLLAALAVSAVAAATGSALRATDVSHRSAVSAMRRVEREEMARELHDVVAHHVTGMVVLTQAARAVLERPAGGEQGSPAPPGPVAANSVADPRLDNALASVERAGAEALRSLRTMVAVLRSSDSDGGEAPLEPAPSGMDLVEVVRRFRDSGAAVSVELSVEPSVPALPAPVQAAVHRVVQESLTNAARYARGAAWVRVSLTQTSTLAEVTIRDSGGRGDEAAGSDWSAASGGFGIVGMRERVGVLGGSLAAGPERDGGWTVRAQVPL